MEQKNIIDLLDGFDSNKVKEQIREKLFKAEKIKSDKHIDPIAIALKVLSDPRKIKSILIVFGILSATGLVTITYFTVSELITLIEYIYKHI